MRTPIASAPAEGRRCRRWSGEVRARLAQNETCTHLKQILIPLASAAYQSMSAQRVAARRQRKPGERPVQLDSCYAYGASRELVRRHWPEFASKSSENGDRTDP